MNTTFPRVLTLLRKERGLSQKQAVAVLYAVSAILGLAAVVLTASGMVRYLLIAAAFAVAVTVWLFVFPRKKK